MEFIADEELCVVLKHVKGHPDRVHITIGHEYLTADTVSNNVYWYDQKIFDDTRCDQWILENDRKYIYIRLAASRPNMTQYLGAPNKSRRGYLYTQKNRWTRWNLDPVAIKNTFKFSYAGDTFDPKELTVVVARYEESVQWVEAYSDISMVYNKGVSHVTVPSVPSIRMVNIGREGHTYLYHIIHNYNSLAKNIVFTQADPFPHNHSILCCIDAIEKTEPIQPLGYIYSDKIPSKELVELAGQKTKYGLQYLVADINRNLQIVGPVPFNDEGINQFILDHTYIYPNQAEMTLIDAFLERAEFKLPDSNSKTIPFSFSGLFKVTSEIIEKHPVEAYVRLIEELVRIHPQGGLNGYILERLWLYIFGWSY
jgi:hypothetical protein